MQPRLSSVSSGRRNERRKILQRFAQPARRHKSTGLYHTTPSPILSNQVAPIVVASVPEVSQMRHSIHETGHADPNYTSIHKIFDVSLHKDNGLHVSMNAMYRRTTTVSKSDTGLAHPRYTKQHRLAMDTLDRHIRRKPSNHPV